MSIGAYAQAQQPARQQPISGSVSSISGTTLNMTARQGTSYTADIGSASIIKGSGINTRPIDAAEIKVGDSVTLLGTISGNSVTATSVRINTPPEPAYAGKVISVNGNVFTIENNKKVQYAVNTTDSTIFRKGSQVGSASDVAVGQTITVSGTINSGSNTVSATSVVISVPPVPRYSGKVTAVKGDSITIEAASGGKTISYTINTTKVSVNDISVGERVVVSGELDSNSKTILASNINVMPAGQGQLNKNNQNNAVRSKANNFGASLISGAINVWNTATSYIKGLFNIFGKK